MKSKTKTTLLLLVLISATIWMAGCKKTNDSILNTWNYTSYGAGFTGTDSPVKFNPTGIGTTASLTFNSNKTFNYTQAGHTFTPFTADSNNNVAGNYYYSNDTLIMYDSRYPNGPINLRVITLTSSTLTLLRTDNDSLLNGGSPNYFEADYYFSR